jgi:hypothetical protein
MKAEAGLDTTDAAPRGRLLWTVDRAGKVTALRVRAGVTDGQKTAIEAEGVREGMSVIIAIGGAAQGAAPVTGTSTNPLTPQRPQGRRGF